MKHMLFSMAAFGILLLAGCKQPGQLQSQDERLIDEVDPFIGTTNAGNQIPGPLCPFGMVHPNPVNNGEDVPLPTNYIYGNKEMYGIAVTNMAGVGCPNYGSVVIMPTMGSVDFNGYRSTYSGESARVGYYRMMLDKYRINVEMTATDRSALMRFHFPAGHANLLVDLSRRSDQDTTFMIRRVSATEIEGYKKDGQFCAAGKDIHHTVYFVAKVDLPAPEGGLWTGSSLDTLTREAGGEDIGAYLSWDFPDSSVVEMRVGISYVSIGNARLNLATETKGIRFGDVVKDAENEWESMLSRIRVDGGTPAHRKMFYTALFHAMSHPNILNDVNGEYPAMGSHRTVKVKDGDTRYTIYSLWDTYRTLHPLFTLAYPEIQEQMCRSIMDMYRENGWLPQWELISRETHVMVGDPACIVLSDTYLKGIHYDDPDTILRAMVHNAEHSYISPQWGNPEVHHIRRGVIPYLVHDGWIPYDYKAEHKGIWATVATTQEYNLADWNISQFARALHKDEIADTFAGRSQGFRHLYDPETKFFRQRYANGRWVEPFDPLSPYYEMPWQFSGGPGYCEGMAWHYDFFVPHDMPGVIKLMGGEEAFTGRLQRLFDSAYYEPSNEPDIAFPFLFNYVRGEEWRTQKTVARLVDTYFGTGTDGIPGNDDTGTMSSWLMFAMMGIYPDCPGNPQYQVSTPMFDKVTIQLNSPYKGKEFVILRKGSSEPGALIREMTLNGKAYDRYTLNHEDVVNGGELDVTVR